MPEHDSSVPIVASKGLECTCELRESESSLLHADCMGGIRILNPDCPIHGKAKSDSDVNEASGSAVEQRAIRCVVHITREYGSQQERMPPARSVEDALVVEEEW